ncbi:GNAT family N-acetyltransferase [Tsukamurella pseudospumae]|uniref:Acetyltransferase n=1 Tax=Tsukamurella pseudospumae TaxID=239498 RepID=A0A137ZZ05_9ACTN|nr:GNAT family N-acetyltransferase [Tsukamurella pseudospumae]KXO97961.1 acetyltransferase [Tsukamurella pseudospumae]KXP03433.1 acetyltransferase [Tsukamurella pseudospumae]
MADVTVTHSPERERYVLTVDGEQAGYLDYVDEVDVRLLTHTVVHETHAGNGYAAVLTKAALDDVRDSGKRARAVCSYVAKYAEKHPEYADVVEVAADR